MRQANILVVGVTGLTNEICKNIVLAGVGSVTIADHRQVEVSDLGSQFFLPKDAIGNNVWALILSCDVRWLTSI